MDKTISRTITRFRSSSLPPDEASLQLADEPSAFSKQIAPIVVATSVRSLDLPKHNSISVWQLVLHTVGYAVIRVKVLRYA